LVVTPHSRSIVPLATSGMRVAGVIGVRRTASDFSFRRSRMATTTLLQMSME